MNLTISEVLAQAITAHKANKLRDAELLYRAILKAQPKHPHANHNLGLLAVSVGKPQQSLDYFKTALEIDKREQQFWLSYLNALIQTEQLSEAQKILNEGKALGLSGERVIEIEQRIDSTVALKPPREKPNNSTKQKDENAAIKNKALSKKNQPTQKEEADILESYKVGNAKIAVQLSKKLVKKYPDHPFGWKALGASIKLTGNLKECLEPMIKSVQLNPNDAEAYSNLGVTFNELGQLEKAEICYREAIRINPGLSEAHCNLGNVLKELGQLLAAELSYRDAVRVKPDLAEAHCNLGNLLKDIGQVTEAIARYKEAIRLKPNFPEAHCNLGNVLRDIGQLKQAEMSYRETIRLKPDLPEAYCNLGNALKDLGQLEEAEVSYRKAILLKPLFPEAHCNLGNALRDLGRLTEGEKSCRMAIQLKSDYAEPHNNLGNILRDLGRLKEAEESYREAIRIKPKLAEAHCNLGNALRDLERLKESEESCRKAIYLKPDYAESHNNLGNTLRDLGRITEAEACYRDAIRYKPNFPEAHSNLGNALKDLGKLHEAVTSYREAIRLKPDIPETHSNLLFSLNYVPSLSPELVLKDAKHYGSIVSTKNIPKFNAWKSTSKQKKQRIGFVSGDFIKHPVGYFLEGLVQEIDPKKFDIFAFSTNPKTDELTGRIKPYFKEWISLVGKSDLEAAKIIHKLGIHVLIDLSGHTAHNRLPVFSYKPAPIQVSWLGYFATTGLPEMDYFLGDPHMFSISEQNHFTEKVWNLPDTWLCMKPPGQYVPVSSLPALSNGYVTFGCFSNLSKINGSVINAWAKVLHNTPGSKLLLKSKQLSDLRVTAEIESRFSNNGINSERLLLEGASSRDEYFLSYNRLDIVLDTFPYPGGTTSVDALWMGIPFITLKGDRFLSHLGESIAFNAGLSDWVAHDTDDYINKTLKFTQDLQHLADLRSSLRDQVLQTPLFDIKLFALNFEKMLSEIWSATRPDS